MRSGSRQRFVHRDAPSEAEGELGAVDAVVAAVDQADGDVHDLEAERALFHGFPDAILNRGNPLLGHRAAVDLLLELEAVAA